MTTTETPNRKGLLIAGIVGVLALCTLMVLAGFVIGRATSGDDTVAPNTAESIAVEDDRVDIEPTAVQEETKETSSTAVSEPMAEEASSDPAAPPDTPAPDPTEPPQPSLAPAEAIDDIDLAVFYEAWAFIQEAYDGEMPPNEEILHALINGSIESLDDEFTRYIRPDIAARLREDMTGSVSGIGAFVRENEEGFFEIVAPIEGQPADLAGLKPGDLIVGVNGEDVTGISFDEVILMVRGEAGTAVNLTVIRQGEEEPLEFSIIRARFDIPVVESEMLENNIAYIQLTEFSRDASARLEEAISELLQENPTGIILDLRNNPGGFLDESIAVGDLFLDEGVVLFERNAAGLDRTFRSEDGDVGETIPLVVLVNGGSASASEIVAGAIQDTGRGILIGTTTFGKGSVQTVRELSDGSELRVTIARWYTPADNSIDKEGIAPDIEVEFPLDTPEDEDPQLDRAIEYLLTGE